MVVETSNVFSQIFVLGLFGMIGIIIVYQITKFYNKVMANYEHINIKSKILE